MDCLFCKIAQKNIEADVVYEDEQTMALLDINPRTKGHVFVIPKEHAKDLLDLPNELVEPVFKTVKKVTEFLKDKLGADGFTIGLNQGRVAGQEVEHLHIHIMPRFEGDDGKAIQGVVNAKPNEDEQKKIKERLLE